jgi:heptaprenyl diphosphate synthase
MGKKTRPLLTLLVIAGVTAFNLLAPYGRVLAELGPFRLTEGSLLAGLRRAVTMEGLIMLSRAVVRPDLRFPGSFGALIGESFRVFERLGERKNRITRRRFFEALDELLLELSAEQEAGLETPGGGFRGTSAYGLGGGFPAPAPAGIASRIILAAAVLLTLGCTLLHYIR